ncbi:MAG TPA: DUF2752 domain-containing protein [Polyangiaceae bacterium]
MDPRARRALLALGFIAGAAAFVAVGPPMCPTALFFGIPCPGCGLTRATLALLSGDFGAALRFHPLVVVLTPVFAYAVGTALFDYVRGGPAGPGSRWLEWFSVRTRYGAALALLVAVLGVWGARFVGYFGGPAPVETLGEVAARFHARR